MSAQEVSNATHEISDKKIMTNLGKTIGVFFVVTLCMALAVAYLAG